MHRESEKDRAISDSRAELRNERVIVYILTYGYYAPRDWREIIQFDFYTRVAQNLYKHAYGDIIRAYTCATLYIYRYRLKSVISRVRARARNPLLRARSVQRYILTQFISPETDFSGVEKSSKIFWLAVLLSLSLRAVWGRVARRISSGKIQFALELARILQYSGLARRERESLDFPGRGTWSSFERCVCCQ